MLHSSGRSSDEDWPHLAARTRSRNRLVHGVGVELCVSEEPGRVWGEARGQREHFPVPVALHSSRAALGLGGCRRPRCAGEVKPCPERDFVQVADFLLSWSELIANFQSSLFSPESWCFWQDPVLIFLRRSGFSSRCPCRLPALGLSLVSAPLQPRGVKKAFPAWHSFCHHQPCARQGQGSTWRWS